MIKKNSDLLSVQWVRDLGLPRRVPPPDDVLDAIRSRTGYSLAYIFESYQSSKSSEPPLDEAGWSFIRSQKELEAVLKYGHVPIDEFAPFAVDYGIGGKKRIKKKNVDWPLDVYGICFAGQFADKEKVLVWDGNRDYVHSWPDFAHFMLQYEKQG